MTLRVNHNNPIFHGTPEDTNSISLDVGSYVSIFCLDNKVITVRMRKITDEKPKILLHKLPPNKSLLSILVIFFYILIRLFSSLGSKLLLQLPLHHLWHKLRNIPPKSGNILNQSRRQKSIAGRRPQKNRLRIRIQLAV